jgi:hypothetical protein
MTTYLAIALLFGASQLASAADPVRRTDALKSSCDTYLAGTDVSGKHNFANTNDALAGMNCRAYIGGLEDEMEGELGWPDDTHKKVVIGSWQDGVTTDQIVRVFADYVDKNPASLNKGANATLRQSVEAVGLYSYAPAP